MANYDFSSGYKKIYSFINRLLITGLITIVSLIFFKKNSTLKQSFYNNFLSFNFDFAFVNDFYKEYFGGVLPFGNFLSSTSTVFSESSLVYSDASSYLDGVSLSVGKDYLVPLLDSGLVVFMGEKDGYGKTVIVQQSNGIDVWYSNLNSFNVNLYEYVSKGEFIGNCNDNLYLVFKKDGKVLDYTKYI